MEDRPCIELPRHIKQASGGHWKGYVLSRSDVTITSFRCVSVQGFTGMVEPMLLEGSAK